MKLKPLSALASFLLVVLSAHAAGADIPAAERTGFQHLRAVDLKADLYFLASDPLQGRLSLQPGDDAATQWVAAEFAKSGLEPAVGRSSYLQAVPLVEYRGDRGASFLKLQRAAKAAEWRAPDLIGGFQDDIEVSSSLVFAGYGISAPGLRYDDYRGIDAHGKIVLVFEHEPQETDPRSVFNGTGNTRYATNRVKALNAQAHGAVALLVMAEPNRKHPSNLERVNRIGGSITRSVPLPAQVIVNDDLQIPVFTVSDAVAAELLAGAGSAPQALQTAIDEDLSNHSIALPDSLVTLHVENKSRVSGVTYNVAGLLPGSDPTLAEETIIISGHHDHDGAAPGAAGNLDIWRGADDNGSGTVGVVALAHAFAANPTRPRRSILFVVFAAEERGLLGSYYMAAHPLRPLATTRAMINFDMIGRDEAKSEQTDGLIEVPANTSNRLNLIGAAYSPDFKSTVVTANRAIGLDLDDRFDHENALNTFFRSDQFPFVLHDIPAFWFFTGFHPDYHHTTDTADKIDYPKMLKILQLSYLSAWQFANQAGYPRFVADPPGG
ncbi:MAG TPA: M20/M25/M40 family metallo-hydrolase [Steroidobacteraceae bacterium]|nr:M20/M25/M40 family metallo-hydrolase [Steroidobacteraceae bacterium]